MDLVELAPGMRPAGGLIDIVAIKMMKAGVGICLQSALEGLQMLAWMFALAILRVCEPYCGCSLFAGRSVIAHIGPEAAGFGLAVARREHRHGRIVGVQLAAGQNMLLNRVYERVKQIACSAYPAGQRGARDLNTLAGVNLRLPDTAADGR